MPDAGASLRVARRLADAGLATWPADVRRRDGPALRAALDAELRVARRSGAFAVLGCGLAEGAVLAREGVGMRAVRFGRRFHTAMRGGGRMMTGWREDMRVAARALGRAPAFTFLATGAIALGVGANAAVFDLADRVLLRPPPYDRPDDLVLVWSRLGSSFDHLRVPAPEAAVLQERATTLGSVAFVGRSTDATFAADASGTPDHVVMAGVAPNLFDVLGVGTALGRGLSAFEDRAAGASEQPAVLISHGVWRRVFGGDPEVVGRRAMLNARPVTVLGVAPEGFRLALPPDAGLGADIEVWVPIRVPLSRFERQDGRWIDQDSDNTGAVVARLAPGATVAAADEEVGRIAGDLRREVPSYDAAGYGLGVRPLHSDATAHARALLIALLVGSAGVLAVACLSVSALLLARGMARQHELAVRAALGAGRWRVSRLLLTESLLLVVLGGGASVVVATGGADVLARLLPPALAPFAAVPTGLPVRFMLACLGGVGGVFLALSLLQSRARCGNGTSASLLRSRFGRARAREALVVAEVAISVVLVLGAALLLRTAAALRAVDAGFRPESALVFDASVRVAGEYTGPAKRALLVRELEQAALAVPGVRAVGLTGALPLSGRRWTQPWGLPGEAPEEWAARRADFRMVTSGYFVAVGTRLVEGRVFTSDEDLDESHRVVVVDETLARGIAPRGSVLGATVGIPLDGQVVHARIVGVVEPVRHDDLGSPAREAIYVPYRQEASRDISFVARTDGDPESVAPVMRRALLAVEPRLAIYGMRPMTRYVDAEIAPTRFGLTLLTTYAFLGLLAAALGLYGVIAWEVGRRTRDLGVRMAIGATARQVRKSVLVRGLRLGGLGLGLGVVLAGLAAGGLRRVVYGVGVADPGTWAAVVALVTAVTFLASWVPARRAARMDPSAALRTDGASPP